ncbi:MAG: uroporphyrinogen-III synthase [Pseudomonadota bacterium]
MPLRLLVTRPQPQADAWVARLRTEGVEAQALPLLAIDTVPDLSELHAAWHDLPRYTLAMFVSPNAVSHFFAARPAAVAAQGWPAGTRAGATGPGTLQALLMAGVPAAQCVAPPADALQFDSAALWSRLRTEAWTGREVLVLRGDGGRDEFAALLRGAGAAVHFTQAYRRGPALPTADERTRLALALAEPAAHMWWLSSTEAVGYLPSLAQVAPGAGWQCSLALASHPRIAERARELGFGHVFEAAPTVDAVRSALGQIEACLQSSPP